MFGMALSTDMVTAAKEIYQLIDTRGKWSTDLYLAVSRLIIFVAFVAV